MATVKKIEFLSPDYMDFEIKIRVQDNDKIADFKAVLNKLLDGFSTMCAEVCENSYIYERFSTEYETLIEEVGEDGLYDAIKKRCKIGEIETVEDNDKDWTYDLMDILENWTDKDYLDW